MILLDHFRPSEISLGIDNEINNEGRIRVDVMGKSRIIVFNKVTIEKLRNHLSNLLEQYENKTDSNTSP